MNDCKMINVFIISLSALVHSYSSHTHTNTPIQLTIPHSSYTHPRPAHISIQLTHTPTQPTFPHSSHTDTAHTPTQLTHSPTHIPTQLHIYTLTQLTRPYSSHTHTTHHPYTADTPIQLTHSPRS